MPSIYYPHETALIIERLMKKRRLVARDGMGPCWEWTGGKDEKGYGRIRLFAGTSREVYKHVHRVSYEIYEGETNGLHVLHSCDYPPCFSPEHLFLGTDLDNLVDRIEKGRPGRAALKLKDVREIKRRIAMGDDKKDIARAFYVHYTTIRDIANGRYWKNVQ